VKKKDELSSLLSLQQQVKKQSDKNMICKLTHEIKTANEDIAKYKTSVKRERNRNKPLTQKIQELSNMLKVMNVDELSVEFLSLQQELKKQSDKINQLTSEKERQQRVLTEKDAMNRNLQDEILSLQQQVNEQLDNGELISEID
jgi:predicted  nucleic acid-binding Zn-ribbon protein